MPDGDDLYSETSGTTPTLGDLYPDGEPGGDEDAEDRSPAVPTGPRDFPGYPSILGRIARWLFGEWSP